MELNEQAGRLIARSAREAKRLAAAAKASARGRGAQAKLRAAEQLEELGESLSARSPSRSTVASAGPPPQPLDGAATPSVSIALRSFSLIERSSAGLVAGS